jgi:hypothetical protein
MPGNVNLNIPARLIESARAAQYANREALDSRVLSEKIKARVKARHAAALRQRPVTPDRTTGGLLETGDPLKWRIWRKRRAGAKITYSATCQRTLTVIKAFEPISGGIGFNTYEAVDAWTIWEDFGNVNQKKYDMLNSSKLVYQLKADVVPVVIGSTVVGWREVFGNHGGFASSLRVHTFGDDNFSQPPLVSLVAGGGGDYAGEVIYGTFIADTRWMKAGASTGNPFLSWPFEINNSKVLANPGAVVTESDPAFQSFYPGIVVESQGADVSVYDYPPKVSDTFQYNLSQVEALPDYLGTVIFNAAINDATPVTIIGTPWLGF